MLIDTKPKLNDVVTVKIIGGDEVIGRLQDEHTETFVELSKPMLVMMAQQGFGLMPYILTAGPDAKIRLSVVHVIALTKTLDAVSKEYIKQTTGLIT